MKHIEQAALSRIAAKKLVDRINNLAAAARKKKGKRILSYGDCGQFAYALCKYLKDPKAKLGLICSITDAEDVEELGDYEPSVYHIYVEYEGMLFDGNGLTDMDEIYGLMEGSGVEDDIQEWEDIDVDEKARQFISGSTSWKNEWTVYYKIFEASEKVKKK